MQTNNSQQPPQQNNQPEFPLFDLLNLGFKLAKLYYSDVHLDKNVRRYRNSKGEFVSEWKAVLFR